MPWCPICKNKFRRGVKVCTDCGCELVKERQYKYLIPLTYGEEEQMDGMTRFMTSNGLRGVEVRIDQCGYSLYVREKDKLYAISLAKVFLEEEVKLRIRREQAEKIAAEREAKREAKRQAKGKPPKKKADIEKKSKFDNEMYGNIELQTIYHNNKERAEENRSSAWTLLFVGVVGLLIVILGISGIISINFGNPYLMYGVMSAIFLIFIVMGVISMKNARMFARRAESEDTLRYAMISWYRENLDAASIDTEIEDAKETSKEILYFNRVQKIKEKFNHQFMNLDQAFLEHFIDDEVYDKIFPDKAE